VVVFQNQTAAAASGFPRFPYTYLTYVIGQRQCVKTTLYRLTGAVMRWWCMFIRCLRPHTHTQSITYTQIRTHPQIYFYPAAHRFIDTPRRHRRTHIHPITPALPPRPHDHTTVLRPRADHGPKIRGWCAGRDERGWYHQRHLGEGWRDATQARGRRGGTPIFFSVPPPARGGTRDGERARPFIELPLPPPGWGRECVRAHIRARRHTPAQGATRTRTSAAVCDGDDCRSQASAVQSLHHTARRAYLHTRAHKHAYTHTHTHIHIIIYIPNTAIIRNVSAAE